MTSEKFTRFEDALIEFIERASSKTATPEEIQALPGAAAAFADYIRYIC